MKISSLNELKPFLFVFHSLHMEHTQYTCIFLPLTLRILCSYQKPWLTAKITICISVMKVECVLRLDTLHKPKSFMIGNRVFISFGCW